MVVSLNLLGIHISTDLSDKNVLHTMPKKSQEVQLSEI